MVENDGEFRTAASFSTSASAILLIPKGCYDENNQQCSHFCFDATKLPTLEKGNVVEKTLARARWLRGSRKFLTWLFDSNAQR